MRLLAPLASGSSFLGRRNPVAKLGGAFGLVFVLVVAADPVTALVALAGVLAAVPLFGIRYGALARRLLPLLFAAFGVFVVTLLFTTRRDEALWTAAGMSLRLVAMALPGVLAFASTDPTDLADALVQQARVPARFAIGALAAWRLAPLLAADWEALTLARRARGIDAGWNPVARIHLFAGTTFALLVGAIRRGTRLAAAMDARAFDAGHSRTVARPQPFGAADAALVVACVALGVLAVTLSVALGTFRPLF
ncbi:energy-coupling factor transporter transmembrane component T family protein [Virgisporangium aurantiacum]|uniref:ABC transporter n=1 Tax=Virgisporangium aurantiacum TaxID=175570 RepID=A0A8J4E3W9_9ACTN|nr:energy-coupling factor transporter transmembrane component T [Virgisporangium aurantiacum]GIJ61345.1 ABC transporter [Virgisporangium aurantiacum]